MKSPSDLEDYKQYYKQGVILSEEKPILQIVDKTGKASSDFNYAADFVLRRLSSRTTEIDMTSPLILLESSQMLTWRSSTMRELWTVLQEMPCPNMQM